MRGLILGDATDIVNGMGRPTDEAQAKSEKFSVRFTPAEVKASREIRGQTAMGSWMRQLVLRELRAHQGEK